VVTGDNRASRLSRDATVPRPPNFIEGLTLRQDPDRKTKVTILLERKRNCKRQFYSLKEKMLLEKLVYFILC